MMKRDFSVSAGVDQSLGVDDGAMAKVKYQTLVGEFLELQKDFVSRKRKLNAAKQNRDTILAEVRFLRRRRNDLLQNEAFNTEKDPVHLSNSYLKSKELKGELSFDGPEAMPENSNRFLLSDSHNGDTDQGVRDNEILDLKPMDGIIHQKTAGKRKISCLINSSKIMYIYSVKFLKHDVLGCAVFLNWIRIMVMYVVAALASSRAYGFTHPRKFTFPAKPIMVP